MGLPSGLLPPGLPSKILKASLLSPIRAKCPAHHILNDLITQIIFCKNYRSLNSLDVSDQIPHLYKTTGKREIANVKVILTRKEKSEWKTGMYRNFSIYRTHIFRTDTEIKVYKTNQ